MAGTATGDAALGGLVAISCHQLPSQRALGHAGLLISKRILLSRVAEWSGREAVRATMGMGRSGVRVRVEAASSLFVVLSPFSQLIVQIINFSTNVNLLIFGSFVDLST